MIPSGRKPHQYNPIKRLAAAVLGQAARDMEVLRNGTANQIKVALSRCRHEINSRATCPPSTDAEYYASKAEAALTSSTIWHEILDLDPERYDG